MCVEIIWNERRKIATLIYLITGIRATVISPPLSPENKKTLKVNTINGFLCN